MDQCVDQLTNVFQDTFQDDEIEVFREMTSKDLDGWDSLMHVSLMMNVEAEFGVRFTSSEVATLKTVGELIDLIQQKQEG